jgi:uncharacterized membrane protein
LERVSRLFFAVLRRRLCPLWRQSKFALFTQEPNMSRLYRWITAAGFLVVLSVSSVVRSEVAFYRLPPPPAPGRAPYYQMHLSADGSTVAGGSYFGGTFRWTPAAGMQPLELLPEGSELAGVIDVSAEGATVLGLTTDGRWATWNENQGIESLFESQFYSASAMSDDGRSATGYKPTRPPYLGTAVRWDQDGGVSELAPGTDAFSAGLDISGDGKTIVGWMEAVGASRTGFRWETGDNTLTPLPPLPNGATIQEAVAVSHNGRHMLGKIATGELQQAAVILRQGSEPIVLSPESVNRWVTATDISDDGNTVLGSASRAGLFDHVFIWDPQHGRRDLHDVLSHEYGLLDELSGWSLEEVHGLSADGRTMLLKGRIETAENIYQTAACVVRVPEPATATIGLTLLTTAWMLRKRRRTPG